MATKSIRWKDRVGRIDGNEKDVLDRKAVTGSNERERVASSTKHFLRMDGEASLDVTVDDEEWIQQVFLVVYDRFSFGKRFPPRFQSFSFVVA